MRGCEDPGGGIGPEVGARANAGLFRPVQARDAAQDRRLSASRRPENREHVSGIAREFDVEPNRAVLTEGDREPAISHGEE